MHHGNGYKGPVIMTPIGLKCRTTAISRLWTCNAQDGFVVVFDAVCFLCVLLNSAFCQNINLVKLADCNTTESDQADDSADKVHHFCLVYSFTQWFFHFFIHSSILVTICLPFKSTLLS